MVGKLILAGASVRAKHRRGTEALHVAAVEVLVGVTWNSSAQVATIDRLIEAGADPNAENRDGITAMHRAVRARCAAAVQTLLNHGADTSIRSKSGLNSMAACNK